MFRRIDHVELVPNDLEKTINFYTEILGFKFKEKIKVDKPPLKEILFYTLGDTMLEILSYANPAPPATAPCQVGFIRIAIEVEDMDKAIAFLNSNGIHTVWGPVTRGTSKRAEILDPNGLSIELRQW